MIKFKRFLLSVLKYVILISVVLVAVVPILVVFFSAFKTGAEFRTTGPLDLPNSFLNFSNFERAFLDGKMLLGFKNTFVVLGISVFGAILTGTMTAFVLHRFTFTGNKLVRGLFLVGSLVPGITMQVTTFQIISKLGLFNTIWSSILIFMATDIIGIYIFLQFLEGIPVSLDEAAIIDGCSYFGVYGRIILPLMKPAIITVLIVKGVSIYNDFYTPFLYMPKTSLNMISTALFKFKGPYGAKWEVICAGIIIAIIPTLIIFIISQKYIYSGMTQGCVKE